MYIFIIFSVPTVSKRQIVTQKNIEESTQYKDEYFNRGVNPKLNKLMNQRKDRDWHSIYLKATSLSLGWFKFFLLM